MMKANTEKNEDVHKERKDGEENSEEDESKSKRKIYKQCSLHDTDKCGTYKVGRDLFEGVVVTP